MDFKGWRKTSLIEYPHHLSSVLFSGGCNFRCPYCYNPDLVLTPDSLADISAADVLAYLAENRNLYEAVMVSGGEPTLHPELPGFLAACRRLGLLTGLETNGSNPDMLARLIREQSLDYVAMDVKAPLIFARYRAAAGLPADDGGRAVFQWVRRSVELLLEGGPQVEFRTTVLPGLHTEQDLETLAASLAGAGRFVLQQFIPGGTLSGEMRDAVPWPQERLRRLQSRLASRFPACELRNLSESGKNKRFLI